MTGSTPVLWGWFVVLGFLILYASKFMARAADEIALLTGLGRSFVGVILLGTATSLPELGAGVTSTLLLNQPDLAAGSAFGACIYNLMVIAILDILWKNGPILSHLTITSAVAGIMSVTELAIASLALIFVQFADHADDVLSFSPISGILLFTFISSTFLVFKSERQLSPGEPDADNPEAASLTRSVVVYAVSAAVVTVAAFFVARVANCLTAAMGWNSSYTGFQFIALSTTLPEFAASLAAIRLNAPELAVSNLLGSNIFNIGFTLFVADITTQNGGFWSRISPVNSIAGLTAIIMTTVVISALLVRMNGVVSRKSTITVEAFLTLVLFFMASVAVFKIS